ncbi:MAG: hypothetical protein ABFD54_15370 [Armatimonadota bacterium]|nr:hypothetical protein [bacterium]
MRHTVLAVAISLCLLASQVLAGPSIQKLNDTRINWTDLVYTATGEGVMPSAKEEPNRARALLKAKGYARMAAIANLLAAIEGTTISYESTGKDYMEDATIRQRIEGYVNNVEVVGEPRMEKIDGDTIVIVTVRAPMFAQSGPGSVFLQSMMSQAQPAGKQDVNVTLKPDLKPATVEPYAPAKSSEPDKPYTSVIFDTTGYKLDRCMSPKIRRGDGSEVWGTVKADFDMVLERGIASYATSMDDAKSNARCGSNPLIIEAIGRAGGKFNSDPVISDADADLLIAENAKSGFLDKFNVIIIKDGRL